jgi:hypothetical protein
LAAAWIGMPVQWNPNGKSALYPLRRLYPAANSAFVREKACPRWRRPFMYGYGKVTMNLGFGVPSSLNAGSA